MRSRRLAGRLAGIAAPLLLAVLLPGCAGEGDPGPRSLVLSNVHLEGYPTAAGLRFLARAVAADPLLSSRIRLDLQLGGTLGNEKEVLEKLRFGGIQMACVSAAPLAEFSRPIGVLTLPYLFRDTAHMWEVLEGEVGDELRAALEEAGFVALAWYEAGARSFYNSRRPVRRLADLEGLKIRVQKSEIMRQTVEALGASPISLGFKQVFTNLHTGAIDGAENNLPSYLSERHFEVARYYSFDRHSMIPDLVLIRRAVWEELDPAERAALRRAALESSREQRRRWGEYVDSALRQILAAGCEVNDVEEPEEFRQAVENLHRAYEPLYGDLIRRIRASGSGTESLPSPLG